MTREPQYRSLSEKMHDPQVPEEIRDLIQQRHVSQRQEVGQTSGSLELAFRRGYQGGYGDGKAGRRRRYG